MRVRIIVSALIEKDGNFLFGRKAPGVGPYPDQWLIIGGGVEETDETLEQALRREVKEETGLEITNLQQVMFDEDIREKKGEMIHMILLNYKADWLSGKPRPGDDITTLQWVKKTDLLNLDIPDVTKRLLKKLQLI